MFLVKEIVEIENIGIEDNLISLGATSIDIIRIANAFDRELGFRPPIDAIYKNPNITGLTLLYQQHLNRQQQHQIHGLPGPKHPAIEKLLEAPPLKIEHYDEFKQAKHGIRKDLEDSAIPLPAVPSFDEIQFRYSTRQFSLKSVPLIQVSNLLSSLKATKIGNKEKYNYGSAGGLYPVQTYLYVKPGRIANLEHGIYYHHPIKNSLYPVNPNASIDPIIYSRLVNRPIFEEAAFGIFLIAQLAAITPKYREHSLHYATLEAGAITQLLEITAAKNDIGLCQIGSVDFYKVSELFKLSESHVLIHSFVGGLKAQETENDLNKLRQTHEGLNEEELKMLNKIEQLSEEEATNLLNKIRENDY